MTPGTMPAVRKTDSIRYVVVVLPFVPVTPTVTIASAGRPKASAETGPMASRTEGTRTCETGGSRSSIHRSTSTATAPRATASAAKSCPSVLVPGTQKKSDPRWTSKER
jgi:hypothetical protein